jgi:hypothetical protein
MKEKRRYPTLKRGYSEKDLSDMPKIKGENHSAGRQVLLAASLKREYGSDKQGKPDLNTAYDLRIRPVDVSNTTLVGVHSEPGTGPAMDKSC